MTTYHTYLSLAIPAILAFVSVYIAGRFLSPYMESSGITAKDYNKKSKPTLPRGLGVALAFGFAVGLSAYVFGASFNLYTPLVSSSDLFACILGMLLISLVGLIDDIHVKRNAVKTTGMVDTSVGLKQWQKPILCLIGALPLIAINAGVSVIHLPFIGAVNFGLLYPLVVLPLAVIFAANAFNLLGGFNGISTVSGIIASLALLVYAVVYGNATGAILAGVLSAALLAFLFFDGYPAKVIPGDSYTYAVGAGLVIAMIVGNMESFGLIVFMPWIIEFLLHVKGRFDTSDLGLLQSDGTLKSRYGKKIYSWTHVIMNLKRCTELEVTLYMGLITFGFAILAFALKILGVL